jgi:hypothetical protein
MEKDMSKTEQHKAICDYLTNLYERKNKDYGDSFSKTYTEYGMAMPCIRLDDKISRIKSLTIHNNALQVKDESVDDSLLDLANYAIMTLIERGWNTENDD